MYRVAATSGTAWLRLSRQAPKKLRVRCSTRQPHATIQTSKASKARLVDASGREYEVPNALIATIKNDRVPPLVALLGAGGLIPYFFYSASIGGDSDQDGSNYGNRLLDGIKSMSGLDLGLFRTKDTFEARHHFLTYSGCIVSFMAAIHWGTAMVHPVYKPGMFVFSVIPPVLAWLSMNMSALPLTEEGTQADATTQPTSSTTEAVPSKPLLLGAQLGTWAIPLINPFMVHALCHVVTFVRDMDAIKAGVMPVWYRKVRVPLAAGAIGSIVVAMGLIATTPEAAQEDAFVKARYFARPAAAAAAAVADGERHDDDPVPVAVQ